MTAGSTTPVPLRNACFVGAHVASHSGEFVPRVVDVTLPGRGLAVQWARQYRSSLAGQLGLLGRGWTATYEWRFEQVNGSLQLRDGQGRILAFAPRRAGAAPLVGVPSAAALFEARGLYAVAAVQKDGIELYQRGGLTLRFEAVESGGRLLASRDANGNAITLRYTADSILITDPLGRVFRIVLRAGRVVQAVDETGRAWTYEYDANDCLICVISPSEARVRYAYDAAFRLQSITDPKGHTFLRNTYDEQGRVASQSFNRHVFSFAYDTQGASGRTELRDHGTACLLIDHDLQGHATAYTRQIPEEAFIASVRADAINGMVAVTTKYAYNEWGEIRERIEPSGRVMQQVREEKAEDPRARGNLLRLQFRTAGRAEAMTSYLYEPRYQRCTAFIAGSRKTTFEYDARGNPTRRSLESGAGAPRVEQAFLYNPAGQLVQRTSGSGATTQFAYYPASDPMGSHGRVVGAGDPTQPGGLLAKIIAGSVNSTAAATVAELGYDNAGSIVSRWNPRGIETEFTVNLNGQVVSAIVGNAQTMTATYDQNDNLTDATVTFDRYVAQPVAGQVVRTTSKLAKHIDYDTSSPANVVSVTYTDDNGAQIVYSYARTSNAGTLTNTVTKPLGNTVTYVYVGGLLTKIQTGSGAELAVTTLTYDSSGNCASIADPNNNTRTFQFQPINGGSYLTAVTEPDGTTLNQEFDHVGTATSEDAAGNTTVRSVQDLSYRAVLGDACQVDGNGDPLPGAGVDAFGNPVLPGPATWLDQSLSYPSDLSSPPDPTNTASLPVQITTSWVDPLRLNPANPSSGNAALGTSILTGLDGIVASVVDGDANSVSITEEGSGSSPMTAVAGVGSGPGASFATVLEFPIVPGSVTVTLNTGIQSTPEVMTDDGQGNLSGPLGSGSIQYDNGQISGSLASPLPWDTQATITYSVLGSTSTMTLTPGAQGSATIQDALGNSLALQYDSATSVVTTSAQTAATSGSNQSIQETVQQAFDPLGLSSTVTPSSLNGSINVEYNILGQLISFTPPSDSDSTQPGSPVFLLQDSFARDAGRATIATCAHPVVGASYPQLILNSVVRDANNNVITRINANNHSTTYGFNSRDELTTVTYADGTTTQITRDLASNFTEVTEAAGNSVTQVFDARGRLTQRTALLPSGSAGAASTVSQTFNYSGNNLLISALESDGAASSGRFVIRRFDSLGRLLEERQGSASQTAQSIQLTYDASGNPTGLVYPSGLSIRQNFDAVGRLTQVYDVSSGALVAQYTYQEGINLETVLLGNGITGTLTYEGTTNRLQGIGYAPSSGAQIEGTTYTFDTRGKRLSEAVAALSGQGERYYYDTANRFVAVRHGAQDPANAQGAYATEVQYALTPAGTWSEVTTLGPQGQVQSQASGSTNQRDQYVSLGGRSFTYDKNGNRVGETGLTGAVAEKRYQYDGFDRLVGVTCLDTQGGAVSSIEYVYDALNRAIQRTYTRGRTTTVTNRYWLDDRLLEEWENGRVVRSYVYGASISDPVMMVAYSSSGTSTYYYLFNGRGLVSALSDANAAISERYGYDVYGTPSVVEINGVLQTQPGNVSSLGNEILGRGQNWDGNAGLFMSSTSWQPTQLQGWSQYVDSQLSSGGMPTAQSWSDYVNATLATAGVSDPSSGQRLTFADPTWDAVPGSVGPGNLNPGNPNWDNPGAMSWGSFSLGAANYGAPPGSSLSAGQGVSPYSAAGGLGYTAGDPNTPPQATGNTPDQEWNQGETYYQQGLNTGLATVGLLAGTVITTAGLIIATPVEVPVAVLAGVGFAITAVVGAIGTAITAHEVNVGQAMKQDAVNRAAAEKAGRQVDPNHQKQQDGGWGDDSGSSGSSGMIDMSVLVAHGIGGGDPLGDMELGVDTAGIGIEIPDLFFVSDPDPGDPNGASGSSNTTGQGIQSSITNNGVTDPLGPDQLGNIAVLNPSTFVEAPDVTLTGVLGSASLSQL
jgi:YD repeat-containing protein